MSTRYPTQSVTAVASLHHVAMALGANEVPWPLALYSSVTLHQVMPTVGLVASVESTAPRVCTDERLPLTCRRFSFQNLPPLPFKKLGSVAFDCGYRELDLVSRGGGVVLPEGSTISFNQCIVYLYKDFAESKTVPPLPRTPQTLFGNRTNTRAVARDSFIQVWDGVSSSCNPVYLLAYPRPPVAMCFVDMCFTALCCAALCCADHQKGG
jgi:hypothetical protein